MIERDAPCSTVISQSQHQVMKKSQAAFLLESGSFIEDILTVQFPTDHLTSVTLNEWTMLLRTDFDLFYEDEPFSVIMLLIHLKSGQFLTRVWNKTISQGVIKDVEDLENVIRSTFR